MALGSLGAAESTALVGDAPGIRGRRRARSRRSRALLLVLVVEEEVVEAGGDDGQVGEAMWWLWPR